MSDAFFFTLAGRLLDDAVAAFHARGPVDVPADAYAGLAVNWIRRQGPQGLRVLLGPETEGASLPDDTAWSIIMTLEHRWRQIGLAENPDLLPSYGYQQRLADIYRAWLKSLERPATAQALLTALLTHHRQTTLQPHPGLLQAVRWTLDPYRPPRPQGSALSLAQHHWQQICALHEAQACPPSAVVFAEPLLSSPAGGVPFTATEAREHLLDVATVLDLLLQIPGTQITHLAKTDIRTLLMSPDTPVRMVGLRLTSTAL